MASGYQTSDGVDLDSRYLGINAKAKSAATADTATKANSVAWGSVTGKPDVTKGWKGFSDLGSVAINKDVTWTAPSDGILSLWNRSTGTDSRVYVYVNNVHVTTFRHDDKPAPIVLKAGTTVRVSAGSVDGWVCYVS